MIDVAEIDSAKQTFSGRVFLAVTPSGGASFRQRDWGTFSQPLDLRDFLDDQQRLRLLLIPLLPNIAPGDVEMALDPEPPCAPSPECSLPEWNISDREAGPASHGPGTRRRADSARARRGSSPPWRR